jgi:hypothetical protein
VLLAERRAEQTIVPYAGRAAAAYDAKTVMGASEILSTPLEK